MTTRQPLKQPPQEIERKFLVEALPPDLERYPCTAIEQGYVTYSEDGVEVRLRHKGDQYYETVKHGGALVRMELEIELTEGQFEALWPTTEGKRLQKIRYKIPYEDRVIELDVYRVTLEGLITADVEFDSIEQSQAFIPPDWLGTEITGHPKYRNRFLAESGQVGN
jgi:adenylate cyclase